MSEPGLHLEHDGHVSIITIDRSEVRNAIGRSTMTGLRAAVAEVAASRARVLVITGGGSRVFVSGGDLKELSAIRTLSEATEMAQTMRTVLDEIATMPVPVIAAINGDAYGGGAEVAVACDIRVAAHDVKCAFNQVALGIMPAWGGVERLTALVGRGRALALMTSGQIITADAALQQGLFDVVAHRDGFARHWQDLAQQIARTPKDALVGIKAAQRAAFPSAWPDLAPEAVAAFARTWIADTHWQMVETAGNLRRSARA